MQPNDIINKMFSHDHFSQWLGIKVDKIEESYSKISMAIREDMLNGFGIAHGGIAYSLADTALAFASNSRGRKAMTITTSINKIEKINKGDLLVAEAVETSHKNTLGFYKVEVKRSDTIVAMFKGTVYITDKIWEE